MEIQKIEYLENGKSFLDDIETYFRDTETYFSFQQLTIITKRSILDVATVLDPSLIKK